MRRFRGIWTLSSGPKRGASNHMANRVDASRPMSGADFLAFAPRLISGHCLDATTGCWHWTSTLNPDGYGQLSVRCESYMAHRISYQIFSGPFASEFHVHHRCGNRACVNPDHLEAITETENILKSLKDRRIGIAPRPFSRRLMVTMAAKQRKVRA
jgi:HNH endonuclease